MLSGDVERMVMRLCVFLLLMAMLPVASADLKPFTTDGCSVFPDGVADNQAKWLSCCIRHDFAYWKGGTYAEREAADDALQQCVQDLGENNLSVVMHLGVRVGGSPLFPTWYRWGYGWPYMRGYQSLSEQERAQIVTQLQVLQGLIGEFISESRQGK